PADVAVVVSGVNDVVGQVSPARALAERERLADWLLGAGLARHVVFAALPPMGRFPLLPQPLARVLGADAARHDAALARWAATRSDVSRAELVVDLDPQAMASDGFHPGAAVYRRCGEALAAHIVSVLDTEITHP
ncbi:MAG TPA: SGNH/GDSL hydrolase family protein, partial [Burkholderiaceae bacterium]